MPWHIAKSGSGYKVVTNATGRTHSKKPLKKDVAIRQLAALHMNAEHEKYRLGDNERDYKKHGIPPGFIEG